MKFVRVTGFDDGVVPLCDRLATELRAGKRTVWLVPGGSNIPLAVQVMQQLPDELTSNLLITLTDERYGEVGHADSNMQQLLAAGFRPKQATILPVLVSGTDIETTCRQYADAVRDMFSHADALIGQFGMGEDGHIAGILPGSPAVSSSEWSAAYDGGTYQRITLTFAALRQLHAAYVFAFGAGKQQALQGLLIDRPLDVQPAQIIKQLPESYVYNDQIGEES